ncbi:probable arabinosyltransferase ARAD1 [Phragmites australis]|uniref:probable arabinosyltransferase ARAD1 n=1 Tax=Phragmites australis TaxID=29695 RepID=UPI002D7952FC|nr:probable arabinosyltransferase ARAD1 [Phragmites australis]
MWERGRPPRKPRPSPILVPPPPSSPPPRLILLLPRSLLALASRVMPSRRPSPVLLLLLALALALLFLLLSPASPSASRFSRSLASASDSAPSSPVSAAPPAPVKIYMYDLPTKFTYGVVRSYMAARAPSGSADPAATLPDEQLRYPGHQHSAEWWLFRDLLLRGPRDRPVARVDDPRDADLFYVPFFSSLSLVVNPIHPPAAANASGAAAAYIDEAMQEELLEWLERQPYWRRNKGRDHVFICQDPNALYRVVDRISNAILLVSDFGRLRGDQASLVKDVILPYSHRINSFKGDIGVEGRPSLLFFMGNRYRKEGGKVRDALFQILENEEDVIIKHGAQSRESRRAATRGMHSSKFCLHPAGDTPSACRLFDALVSLCVPVIVSDYIELPFEDVLDYNNISVFVETSKAIQPGYLTSMLRRVSSERILEYQREIKKVKHYFEYEDPNGPVNEIWRQVSLKAPLIKLLTNRNKRMLERGTNRTDCSCICSTTPNEISTAR